MCTRALSRSCFNGRATGHVGAGYLGCLKKSNIEQALIFTLWKPKCQSWNRGTDESLALDLTHHFNPLIDCLLDDAESCFSTNFHSVLFWPQTEPQP